jgi:putative transposase
MTSFAPQDIRTFFVTSNCWNHTNVLQSERMATLMLDVLSEQRAKEPFKLHEYVVMPDHFHLIITPAYEHSIEKCGQFIKGNFSIRAGRELQFKREIWQESFRHHRIMDNGDYRGHRLYIWNNPVKRGLVARPEDWPYSSANPKIEIDPAPLPLRG